MTFKFNRERKYGIPGAYVWFIFSVVLLVGCGGVDACDVEAAAFTKTL